MAMASAASIGPYEILAPLGQGGMGVVYRARHAVSERPVALKTVKLPAPRWLDSIRREIDALTRIRHPGIVRILEHGVHEGRPWYAMDLLEGESLRAYGQRLWSPYNTSRASRPLGTPQAVSATEEICTTTDRTSRPPPAMDEGSKLSRSDPDGQGENPPPAAAGELRDVLKLMRRVCATLAFLHGEGFVNCDLKPENILLVAGQPVLIDFGLTAQHPGGTGREALEARRGMSGTLPYMSPEQIRGEFVDARSDLYSVGCLLYELVVGKPPFSGAAPSVRSQHLWSSVVRPSELVGGVSPELERVILKLLEKNLSDRFGFADEVATALAELGGDVHRLTEFPPPRPYLYRPRFVGRADVLETLAARREQAAAGSGAFFLLGGESGVGKTRVAMELTRFEPAGRMRVVTSEASALSAQSAAAVGAAPLQMLRPLLRAVADQCLEGGPAMTEQLLGPRRAVLALYEPLLAQVPASDPLTPPVPLDVDASRRRLFRSLSEVLAAFAQEQPVLWVIDDLGWADELSIDFLRSLTLSYLESTALFILCTYRTEEITTSVAELARSPHVTDLRLPRLPHDAVAMMIADMLALPEKREGFVEFITRQAEGNPFFVVEHVRTAVTERVLYRDQNQTWQLEPGHGASQDYESLPLPKSLREAIDQRLRKLTPVAQQVSLAAAVLGRDLDLEVLREVVHLPEETAARAVDELLRRQILEQLEERRVRFVHDKLREVAYSQAPHERISELHARAAETLEALWKDRPDANRFWAILGHHFSVGKRPERAVQCLKRAADHARATYANGDAIRLYREAIHNVNESVVSESVFAIADASGSRPTAISELLESLADVLALAGRWSDAASAYQDALRHPSASTERVARLHRKLGKTLESRQEHQAALRCYAAAREVLGADFSPKLSEWIDLSVDELWTHYWLDRRSDMDRIVAELRPFMREHASSAQRHRFLQAQMLIGYRSYRYRLPASTVVFARAARDACEGELGLPERRAASQFDYGFSLLFHGALDVAHDELKGALESARHVGDVATETRSLTYLAIASRMRGRVDDTSMWCERADAAAAMSGMREYTTVAHANAAWVSLRQGRLEDVTRQGNLAVDSWSRLPGSFPFQWLALLPLMEADIEHGALERALAHADRSLDPGQHLLPNPFAESVLQARTLWAGQDHSGTESELRSALTRLDGTGFR
jgi:serine/threonine protein kinase/tetratricopeptide (TPR) repeat protein